MDTTSLDLEALASAHRTPFYVYDMDAAAAHTRRLRKLLPDFVDLLYCAKANANKVVLGSFKAEVQGLDISSAGELDLATAVGWSPSVMSFAGPGKNEDELERAIRAGVRIISIESPTELRRASKLAKSFGASSRGTPASGPVGITLRINPSSAPKEFPMKMGGLPSQFGVPEEDAEGVMEEALRTEGIQVLGVHVYSGTNSLEPRAIVDNALQTCGIAARLADKFDKTWDVVNLGGGFGVPYFPGQVAMNMEELAGQLSAALRSFRDGAPRFARTRMLLELGRYLIAEHGAYVTRVVDVKETRGKRFAILDGGMHHCFPATGNFGQVIKKNWPIHNASHPDAEKQVHDLVGPLCTPIDSMARAIELPRADIDDLVVFDRCGAYSFAASPILFLSHDTPPELVKKDGSVALVRERRPASFFQ